MNSIMDKGLIAGGREKEEDRWFFFTPLNPSGEDFDEETQDESVALHRKVHFTNFRKDEQDAVYWVHLVNAQDPGFAILAKNPMQLL